MAKLQAVKGSTSIILQVFIQDSSSTTGAGKSGLAFNTSSLTCYYHRDTDTSATVMSLVTMTVGTFTSLGFKEIDATNMPGWYQLCPPNAALASGAKSVAIHLQGAAGMAPLPLEIELTAFDNQDGVRGALTALPNAAAEAAGGLYTRGSGAGQINQAANGQVDTNVARWLNTAVSTPTVAGVPNVNAKTWNDLATVALPLVPTTAGRTLDVSVGGEAGLDWANIGSPTTTVALTGSTIATTQKVDVETIKTQAVTAAAGVTFPTTIASPTNITAGTITTVTNLTNAPTAGDFTATMKTSIGTAVASSAVASVTGNIGGNVSGSVASIGTGGISAASFASGAIDSAAIAADAIGSSELAASAVDEILDDPLSDSIPADGTLPTVRQALYMMTQFMFERSVTSTTVTVKKVDGSTSLFTLTLNDGTTPTSITRAT